MPCRDWEGIDGREMEFARHKESLERDIDRLARMLCAVCQYVDDNCTETVDSIDTEAGRWWTSHKREDLRKKEKEREKQLAQQKLRERAAKKAKIIAKLSPEEREILGLG